MKIIQIRNATIIIDIKGVSILVDPMRSKKSALPRLRYYKSHDRNPLVELPESFHELKTSIDYALITHCQKGHFDHLDRAGVNFLIKNKITTFCTQNDARFLQNKGIQIHVFKEKFSSFFEGFIQQIPARQCSGRLAPFMEHGVGYFINLEKEPSLYLMGDTILTDKIWKFIVDNQPDYIVAPKGKAQFDIGTPILLDEKEIIELASLSTGSIIANHMAALDHCRISRQDLKALIKAHCLCDRFMIPDDGETLNLIKEPNHI